MAKIPDSRPVSDENDVFYTTIITLRNGQKLHASAVGKKVFRCVKRKAKKQE